MSDGSPAATTAAGEEDHWPPFDITPKAYEEAVAAIAKSMNLDLIGWEIKHLDPVEGLDGTYIMDVTARFQLCRSPRAWDRLERGFARVMGPPELPVMGPPARRVLGCWGPAASDLFMSMDVGVAGGIPVGGLDGDPVSCALLGGWWGAAHGRGAGGCGPQDGPAVCGGSASCWAGP
jgi:hypothetical protein